MNICFWYFRHAFITNLPWILWSFVRIKLKRADLFPFLFAQTNKKIENVVCPDENLQHTNEYLFPIIYIGIYYNPPMNPYNLQQSFYPVGDTIALAIYLFKDDNDNKSSVYLIVTSNK